MSVSVGGDDFGRVREIEAEIRAFPQILECYSVSGEDDYLLKVVAPDLKSLSNFLTDRLMQVPGIDDVRSMICLEEIKPASACRCYPSAPTSSTSPTSGSLIAPAARLRAARRVPRLPAGEPDLALILGRSPEGNRRPGRPVDGDVDQAARRRPTRDSPRSTTA